MILIPHPIQENHIRQSLFQHGEGHDPGQHLLLLLDPRLLLQGHCNWPSKHLIFILIYLGWYVNVRLLIADIWIFTSRCFSELKSHLAADLR